MVLQEKLHETDGEELSCLTPVGNATVNTYHMWRDWHWMACEWTLTRVCVWETKGKRQRCILNGKRTNVSSMYVGACTMHALQLFVIQPGQSKYIITLQFFNFYDSEMSIEWVETDIQILQRWTTQIILKKNNKLCNSFLLKIFTNN